MMLVIESVSEYDLTRAPARACGGREVVEPHNDEMEEIDEHYLGKVRVWESSDDAATPLFDNTDTAFDFANVLPSSRKVECGVVKVGADLFELIVHEYSLNSETRTIVNSHNTLE